MMKANYHTHTARCGHAGGTDEQYVLAALSQHFDVLGFSDHVPWPYESGFTHRHVRMGIEQLDEYVAAIRALKRRYAGRIELLVGFECECFPQYMSWLAEMKEEKQLDYLIFGNHYEETDEGGFYFGNSAKAEHLRRYVDSAERGARTELFAYMAHPDLFMRRYPLFDADCRAAARDLCQICKQYNLPMEVNLHDRYRLGEANGNGYPNAEFFEIAHDAGMQIILGLDAHEPQEIADPREYDRAMAETARFGEKRLDRLSLRKA